MTLTLEQVRQTRFHLARRNGYEPVDVDNFVDKVEATLAQLTEENEALKHQIGSLSSSQPTSVFVPSDSGDGDRVRADLQRREAELAGVRNDLAGRSDELNRRNQELGQTRDELARAHSEIESLRSEVNNLRQAGPAASQMPVGGSVISSGKIENIVVTTSAEASPAVTRLLQMATEQAERLVGESQVEAQRILTKARAEAETVIDSANRKAHETLTDARTRADRIESEARVNAEKLTAEAQQRADALTTEAETKRSQMFTKLEAERDSLRMKVDQLRAFESNYRSLLTNHLQTQLRSLGEVRLEPAETPEIMRDPMPGSATPRLDALLGESHG
jgi:colicin import membrane protein